MSAQTASKPIDSDRPEFKVLFGLLVVHFIGDLYMSFINPLLPVLADKFTLSLTQVGLLTGATRILAFVVQPTVGYMADRYRTRLFVLGGPLLTCVFVPLMGVTPYFGILLLFACLGSIGQAMFHPQAAGMVAGHAGRHGGLGMSIFGLGGTSAFALGPVAITWFVSAHGLESLPWTSTFGLIIFVVLIFIIPMPQHEGLQKKGFIGSLKESIGDVWRIILIIWAISVLRAFVQQSIMTYIPMLYSSQGMHLVSIGTVLSLSTLAGSISGLVCGHLSDRIGYRPIYYFSFILAAPALLAFVHAQGIWVFIIAFISGFIMFATMFPSVALAQKLAPKGRSMVSSLVMGLAFGAGGMMTPLTGIFSDHFGIQPVLTVVACLPLLALPAIAKLPRVKDL